MLWDCPKTSAQLTANAVGSAEHSVGAFLTNPAGWRAEAAFWSGVANDLLLTLQSTGASTVGGQPIDPVQISNSSTCPGNGYYIAGQWFGAFAFGLAGGEAGLEEEEAILGSKLDFLFGQATGSQENVERSVAMLNQLARIGIPDTAEGRAYVAAHLIETEADPGNVAITQANGRVIRDSLLMGPRGSVKVQSVWEGKRLVTAMLFGARG